MAWQDCKDSGPWPFDPQADKPCYNIGSGIACNDNPVWSMEEGSGIPVSPVHSHSCGYWTSMPAESLEGTEVNIYGLFVSFPHCEIYSVLFDGETLAYVNSYYAPSESLTGLAQYDGNLITIANSGASASLRIIDPTSLALINETYPFGEHDFADTSNAHLVGSETMFLVTPVDRSYIKLQDLSKVGKGFLGTVVLGTDGNMHAAMPYYSSWNFGANPLDFRPVSGSTWSQMWSTVPGNVYDGPVVNWGDGTCFPSNNTVVYPFYHEGQLYLSYFVSPNARINIADPVALEIELSGSTNYSNRMIIQGDTIYTLGGFQDCRVFTYDKTTLAYISQSDKMESGRAFGDLVVMSGKLIISTTSITPTHGGLYKINLDTLEIEDQIIFSVDEPNDYSRLCKINERYVVAGREGGVAVFDVIDMELVDYINIPGLGHMHSDIVVMM